MSNLKQMIFPFLLGCAALFASCGDDTAETEETEQNNNTPVCNSDGTCDAGENFGNCAADCNALCTSDADIAYSTGVVGDGAWDETECSGKLALAGCQGAGLVGARVDCSDAADAAACGAITGCTWAGDALGCIATTAAACGAYNTNSTACTNASCVHTGTQCVPPPTEANCTAGSAWLLANKGVSCTWDSTTNTCGYPKTGADAASSAATSCGTSCLLDEDKVACSLTCMKGEDKLGTSLTDGCLTCYAAVLGCTLENCILECGAIATACNAECSEACNTALFACRDCRTEAKCSDAFTLCASGPATE